MVRRCYTITLVPGPHSLIFADSYSTLLYFCVLPIYSFMNKKDLACVYSLLDITSLGDLDSPNQVTEWSSFIAKRFEESNKTLKPAAICVYAPLVKAAAKACKIMDVPLAAVTGNFPSGKAPVALKIEETKYAIAEGATEIDLVIDRGACHETNGKSVFIEVDAIRNAFPEIPLKVILESGQFESLTLLEAAANEALNAGATMLKTSTGKIPQGASPEAASLFCRLIAEQHKKGNTTVGFKASGGVRSLETALQYIEIFNRYVGSEKLSNSYLRIGASALADAIAEMHNSAE
jgi:deoxyribose-phosphate aldolase